MTSDYAWWERHGPRLPSHGIKAQTRRGAFGKTWWASRWIAALERLVNAGRLARGRTYARTGQVVSLEVDRTGVKAAADCGKVRPNDSPFAAEAVAYNALRIGESSSSVRERAATQRLAHIKILHLPFAHELSRSRVGV